MDNVLIYRACDRPKYAEHTLPHLLEHTSHATGILMVENSSDPKNSQAYLDLVKEINDGRVEVYSHGARMGVNNALRDGISMIPQMFPKQDIKYVLTVDDDILCPTPADNMTWDEVLTKVLDLGKYYVVAFKVGGEWVDPKNLTDHSGWKILEKDHVSGGGATGLRLDVYRKHPFGNKTDIFTYGKWMSAVCRGKIGYVEYPNPEHHSGFMRSTSIDNARHPLSLRNTEYKQYSDDIWYHRHPSKRGTPRPEGA